MCVATIYLACEKITNSTGRCRLNARLHVIESMQKIRQNSIFPGDEKVNPGSTKTHRLAHIALEEKQQINYESR